MFAVKINGQTMFHENSFVLALNAGYATLHREKSSKVLTIVLAGKTVATLRS